MLTIKITNFEKKKMIPMTKEEDESYLNQTNGHICNIKFEDKHTNHKNILELETIAIILVNIEVLHIAYVS